LLRDVREPFVGRGRGDQKNRIESVSKQCLRPRFCFLGNQICHEHSIDPSLVCGDSQLLFSQLQEWIEIAEKNDRHIDLLSRFARTHERVPHADSIPQRAFGCALNYLTVGDRITEGHAYFDDVCSSRSKLDEQALSS
jgi:hypothetical protein